MAVDWALDNMPRLLATSTKDVRLVKEGIFPLRKSLYATGTLGLFKIFRKGK